MVNRQQTAMTTRSLSNILYKFYFYRVRGKCMIWNMSVYTLKTLSSTISKTPDRTYSYWAPLFIIFHSIYIEKICIKNF